MPSIILPPLSPTTFTNPKTEKDYQRLDYCALISSFDLNGFYTESRLNGIDQVIVHSQ